MVAKGGAGGTLHTAFEPSRGQAKHIRLDLKLIADMGLVGWEQERMPLRLRFSLDCASKHWILFISNQIPKRWKILSLDGSVECHPWDCKLRMSVHCNFNLAIICVVLCLHWFWIFFKTSITVTTLKPEIGKVLYEDYKQVWKGMSVDMSVW